MEIQIFLNYIQGASHPLSFIQVNVGIVELVVISISNLMISYDVSNH